MRKHRMFGFWYKIFVVPVIIYFLFNFAAALTIENPKLYKEEIKQQKIAEKLVPYISQILGQNSPEVRAMRFEPIWIENNLISIISGLLDYYSGRADELSLPFDTRAIYNQLSPEAKNGQINLSGVAEYASKVKEGQGNLIYFYQGNPEVEKLKDYSKYLRTSRVVDYSLIAILIITIALSFVYLKKDWPNILGFIGRPFFVYGSVILIIIWGGSFYYSRFLVQKILAKLIFDWQNAIYNGLVSIFEKFLIYITFILTSLIICGIFFLIIQNRVIRNAQKSKT